MPLDAYDPCPCGSGKKLKFCCHELVDGMRRVLRFQENQQTRMALQALEALENDHPGNSWVITTRAVILLREGRGGESTQGLEQLVGEQPDHLFAIALYATAMFSGNGFEGARPAIQRAFQRCSRVYPDLIASLATGIATAMFASRKQLAAREHLVLAMRLGAEQKKQTTFLQLLELDGNQEVPYPLRSVHRLVPYAGDPENEKQAQQAARLSGLGCWNLAAKLFADVAGREADNANLWQNAGFCHAWDGDEAAAAKALHRAAQLHEVSEAALECETIAQLLDLNTLDQSGRIYRKELRVNALSKLLTLLDNTKRLARIEIPPSEDAQQPAPAALYEVLDRDCPEHASALDLDSVPLIIGQLTLYDEIPDGNIPARIYITAPETADFEVCQTLLSDLAGSEVEPIEGSEVTPTYPDAFPRELQMMRRQWYLPAEATAMLDEQLEREHWRRIVEQTWPETNLTTLDGRTPLEAVGDDQFKIQLMATLYVFDAYCNSLDHTLDFDAVCNRLELETPEPIAISDDTSLNSFSSMELLRLPLDTLSDAQLVQTLNRALLIHHGTFLYNVLSKIVGRPACHPKVDLNQVYTKLAELCRDQFRREEAFRWIATGKELARTLDDAFAKTLEWNMRELKFRLDDPQDAALKPLLLHIYTTFCPKESRLEPLLHQLLAQHNITPPWDSVEGVITSGSMAEPATGSGVWTPAQAADSSGGEKKLWIPGQ
jgi:hypothetical protein